MKLKNGLKNVNTIGFMDGKMINAADWIEMGGMLMVSFGIITTAIGKIVEQSHMALYMDPRFENGNNPNISELYRHIHDKHENTSDK